jgi:hypothetical protein
MIEYNDLNAILVERFPELKPWYQEAANLWEGQMPGPHVIYGDVFVPYLIRTSEVRADEQIRKVADFIEVLVREGDELTRELVEVTICEAIVDNEVLLKVLTPFLGAGTRRIAESIGRRWGVQDIPR